MAEFAGIISTSLFIFSNVPMLIKARRTKDLNSYSGLNLLFSNIGNFIHWIYVCNLLFGPIWFLHGFYTIATFLMFYWFLQNRRMG